MPKAASSTGRKPSTTAGSSFGHLGYMGESATGGTHLQVALGGPQVWMELADLLEREVVTAISGKANGLIEASAEDTVISEATVPAAAIKVGYLTNGQESILLQREDYIQRIAEGIYQTILKAYEE